MPRLPHCDASVQYIFLANSIDYGLSREASVDGELNFHQLALFRAVGRSGGVGAAAETLDISQPSVSAQVRALERSLGLVLLERSGRTVRPTEHGRRVLEYADCIFALVDDLRREVADLRDG